MPKGKLRVGVRRPKQVKQGSVIDQIKKRAAKLREIPKSGQR